MVDVASLVEESLEDAVTWYEQKMLMKNKQKCVKSFSWKKTCAGFDDLKKIENKAAILTWPESVLVMDALSKLKGSCMEGIPEF